MARISVFATPRPGRTARRASHSPHWNSWRSWPRSCPCRVCTSSAMPAAWRRTATYVRRSVPPHASRVGRRGNALGNPVLDRGAALGASLWPRSGHVSLVSARDPAAHRRHHAGRGDPHDPAPSETLCRPTPHRAGPFPPSTIRLGRLRPRRRAWVRQPRARRGGEGTPPTVCTPGPGHPDQSSPTASSAPGRPAGGAGASTPTTQKGF
jgi:hypothetical protein